MNGIERPLSVVQKFFRNNCTNVSFVGLLITSLIATCALIASEAKAQDATSSDTGTTASDVSDTTTDIATSSSGTAGGDSEAADESATEPPRLEDESAESAETNLTPGQTNRNTRQLALTERRQERIVNLAANTSNRIEGAIARLEQINSRIERRIEKLEGSAVDTAEALRLSAAASENLQAARDTLTTIDADVTAAITSAAPAAAWGDVRRSYIDAASLTRSAHQNLVAVVQALETPASATEADLESNE